MFCNRVCNSSITSYDWATTVQVRINGLRFQYSVLQIDFGFVLSSDQQNLGFAICFSSLSNALTLFDDDQVLASFTSLGLLTPLT
jgi:hypothetical protein